MLKIGLTAIVGIFIVIAIYANIAGPMDTLTETLSDTVDGVIKDGTIEKTRVNTHLDFIPTLLGVIAVFLVIASVVGFVVYALAKEREEFEYYR